MASETAFTGWVIVRKLAIKEGCGVTCQGCEHYADLAHQKPAENTGTGG